MNSKLIKHYSRLRDNYQFELDKFKRKGKMIAIFRGLLFLLFAISLFLFQNLNPWLIAGDFVLFTILFLFLVKRNVELNNKARKMSELIKINRNELSGLNGKLSVFDPGNQFIDPAHPYSFDLDIFGNESVYQLVNRTCTAGGANLLATELRGQKKTIHDILEKQEAIKELSAKPDWRQNFQATGNIILDISNEGTNGQISDKETNLNYLNENRFHNEMLNWLVSPFYFLTNKFWKLILLFSPLGSIFLLVLVLAGLFPVLGFILFGLIQLIIIGFQLKKINRIHGQIGRKSQIVKKYGELLSLIEKTSFSVPFLADLKNKAGLSHQTAAKKLRKLHGLASALDNRLNILISIVANAYLLWDLQVVYRIEIWRKDNVKLLPEWLELIYQFDAISGFAAFSYNNPAYCFPDIRAGEFELEMKNGGHPLINDQVRICNDLKMGGNHQLLVITGANMAGKSTFLRTAGINLVLAMAGSVVCADKFSTGLIELHTSIRTTDSVQKNESYFYAELVRLKSIIDRLQQGDRLFIIIDEMLRGTNSKDKHLGSQALIEQLIRLKGSGLLATHDIALGQLAEKYPEHIKNFRFEVEIKDNELFFDYQLKSGISQNLNATFLMKKMGITL